MKLGPKLPSFPFCFSTSSLLYLQFFNIIGLIQRWTRKERELVVKETRNKTKWKNPVQKMGESLTWGIKGKTTNEKVGLFKVFKSLMSNCIVTTVVVQ